MNFSRSQPIKHKPIKILWTPENLVAEENTDVEIQLN